MHRFTAVEGPDAGSVSGDAARSVRARRQQLLLSAASRSAFEQMHIVGWLLLALVPLLGAAAPSAWARAPAWLWAGAALGWGTLMLAWPRRRWRPEASSRLLTLLAGAAALLAAAPAALMAPLGANAHVVAAAWVWVVAAFATAVAATVAP
ncbi:MAG: hypothetical protein KIT17_19885, partial [Rubrivivax sp.]|nr:hypothetical protein [Rubrivivax sp.]